MNAPRTSTVIALVCLGVSLVQGAPQNSQSASASTSQPPTSPSTTVPRLIKFSGVLKSVDSHLQAGSVSVNLALYELQQGGSPLWTETQTVILDEQGRYTLLLGATQPQGLPIDLFTSGKALWLAVDTAAGAPQPRVLLVAVPYALKAADADTLGGKPASAYALAGSTTVVPLAAGAQSAPAIRGRSGGSIRAEVASSPQPAAPCGVTSDGTATPNTIAKFTSACNIQNSNLTDTGTKLGLFLTNPTYDFDLSKSQDQDTIFRVRNPNPGSHARANLRLEADSTIFSVIAQSIANGKSVIFQGQNDNNMAFQQIANAPITFYTTAAERVRILGNGNVGIGTSTPTAVLEVNGTAKFDQTVTFLQPLTSSSQLISTVSTGTAPLQVNSTTQVTNLNASFLGGIAASGFAPATGSSSYVAKNGDTMTGPLNLPANGLTAGTNQLVLSGGNVGVGTTAPTAPLEVDAPSGDRLALAQYDHGRLLVRGEQVNPLIVFTHSTDPSKYTDPTSDDAPVVSYTGIVGRSGEVPVENTWTGYDFDSATTDNGFTGSRIAAQFAGLLSGQINSDLLFLNANYPAGLVERMRITSQGKVGIGTTTPTNIFTVVQGGGHAIADGWDTYSSRRWKSNIHTIHGALVKVEELRGVQYTYTANGHRDIGMIAEEVGKVVPEVVSYEANGKDAQGIDYARLTALLVQAVKEQESQIQRQQSQIKQQQAEIQRLESAVEALKRTR
jgi:hypothetical protein